MYKYNRRIFINFTQIFYDIICIMISFVIATIFSHKGNYAYYLQTNIWIPVLYSILFICIMHFLDMYNLTTFTYQDRALRNILISCMFSLAVCLFVIIYVQPENAGKLFFTIFLLVALITLTSLHVMIPEIRKIRNVPWESRAVIIGSRDNIQEYLYYLKKTSFAVRIIGYISLDGNISIPDLIDLGEISKLHYILTRNAVDEVIFAVHYSKIREMEQYIVICEERGLITRIALDFSEMSRVKSYIHSIGTIPVLTFHTAVQNNIKRSIKRIFDIVFSFIGLLLLAAVSIPVIPIIRINSRGKVFHKEDFTTINGRKFKLVKFNTDNHTCVGRLLKSTGLDGLPQIINVLRGDMSIVGTCPTVPMEVEKFSNHEFRRLTFKPGITGLWKINNCETPYNAEELAAIDERYINNWSLARDFVILVKSLFNKGYTAKDSLTD